MASKCSSLVVVRSDLSRSNLGEENPKLVGAIIHIKTTQQNFPWMLLVYCTGWFYLLSLWLKSLSVTDHLNESRTFPRYPSTS